MPAPLIDISRTITPHATVYPGDPALTHTALFAIGPDCPFSLTGLNWSTHFLTHLDPPAHFIAGGATIDEIPLERFTGIATVVEVDETVIEPHHFHRQPLAQGSAVFFKTRHSAQWSGSGEFERDHVYLSSAAAQEAVALGLNMVGIDYLSVDRYGDEDYPAHRTLLGNGILILEGLDLSQASPGQYRYCAFPLKIGKGDGAPVRAVLMGK